MTAISLNQAVGSLFQDLGTQTKECEAHGPFISSGKRFTTGKGKEIWTVCPKCTEDRKNQESRAIDDALAAVRRESIEKMLSQTAIPRKFIGRGFDNFVADTDEKGNVLRTCQEYVANFESHLANGLSLVFSGGPGTGKSHLAASILQGILPRHVGVYLTFMGMIRLIRETWHPSSARRESEVLAELGSLPLLVLDEIGVQYGTEAEHTLLFEVMDRRYRDQRPSILLTNQNKEGFKHFVGDRVYDRMTETARWVSFPWESFRTEARKIYATKASA
jgi:DNA replication protein DnaC